MSEMLERVALAIERERWVIAVEQMRGAKITSLDGSRRTALAAAKAMREPTEAMLAATGELGVPDAVYIETWKQMIDAAICQDPNPHPPA